MGPHFIIFLPGARKHKHVKQHNVLLLTSIIHVYLVYLRSSYKMTSFVVWICAWLCYYLLLVYVKLFYKAMLWLKELKCIWLHFWFLVIFTTIFFFHLYIVRLTQEIWNSWTAQLHMHSHHKRDKKTHQLSGISGPLCLGPRMKFFFFPLWLS